MERLFKDEDVEALFCAISIIQPDWINEARDERKKDKEVKCSRSERSHRASRNESDHIL